MRMLNVVKLSTPEGPTEICPPLNQTRWVIGMHISCTWTILTIFFLYAAAKRPAISSPHAKTLPLCPRYV